MKKEFIYRFEHLKKIKSDSADKTILQQRGREFEELMNDVFNSENILLRKGYHTSDNKSEQIDGAIEVDNRVFLIEAKWVSSNVAASELFAFIGKIENKFFGTLGVFISRKELSSNFVNALNRGRRQSVLIIHGEDIDSIFSDNVFSIGSYLSHALKISSYDNVVHFPIRKYIELINQDKSTLIPMSSDSSEEYLKFIKDILLGKSIKYEELLVELASQSESFKNNVYSFIITKYSDYWRLGLKKSDFKTIDNFNYFLQIHKPAEDVLKTLAECYYKELIFKDLQIYCGEAFINLFSNFYSDLQKLPKASFENQITKLLTEYNNNSSWDSENKVTEIIKPIWDYLAKETQTKLKDIYLNIYVRDTLAKFSQKKFANFLVKEGIINKPFAIKWLNDKVVQARESFDSLDESDIKFIAKTYVPINDILNEENWFTFIENLFNN